MDSNTDQIAALAKYIASAREFAALRQAKADIANDAALSARLARFEQKQKLFNNQNLPESQRNQIYNELNSEYAAMNAIPALNRYFAAAGAFSEYINGVFESVAEAVNWYL